MIGGEHLPSIYYIINIIWRKKVIFFMILMIGGEHLPSIYYIINIIWRKKVIFFKLIYSCYKWLP